MIEYLGWPFLLKGTDESGAAFDPHSTAYRYLLWRRIPDLPPDRRIMFIGLNPSTADETQDDPTIRRCRDFATQWCFGMYIMANLFAYRSTDPWNLYNPTIAAIGSHNDRALLMAADLSEIIVCAWSRHATYLNRDIHVVSLLSAAATSNKLRCFRLNNDGTAVHPLYLKKTSWLVPYAGRGSAAWREPASKPRHRTSRSAAT